MTPKQVALKVQAKASDIGDEQPPTYRTVLRVLKPLQEKQLIAKSIRSPGWRGSTLSVKTRDGDDLEISYSNQVWQCDHTRVDVLLVDQHGELIGRPWLTTVINSYSRCIMGINLGFDAPSSQVVALALRHRMEWQFKSTAGCERHQLRLLSKCHRCGARFKVPALWEDGCYDRCRLPFGEMAEYQKSVL